MNFLLNNIRNIRENNYNYKDINILKKNILLHGTSINNKMLILKNGIKRSDNPNIFKRNSAFINGIHFGKGIDSLEMVKIYGKEILAYLDLSRYTFKITKDDFFNLSNEFKKQNYGLNDFELKNKIENLLIGHGFDSLEIEREYNVIEKIIFNESNLKLLKDFKIKNILTT